jgi:hypothetical protein
MKGLFSSLIDFPDFSLKNPGNVNYSIMIVRYTPSSTVISQSDSLQNSPITYSSNYSVNDKPVGEEIITHPVIETKQGKQRLTRIKKRFTDSARNILGLTVPETNTYHINAGADGLNSVYPEKSVDVHEMYHIIAKKLIPFIGRRPHTEETTVRKTTDKLKGTKSAQDYLNGLEQCTIRDYAPMYGIDMAREIAKQAVKKIDMDADVLSDKLIKEPVKIYLPTNDEEEQKLERGELPPYVNTSA